MIQGSRLFPHLEKKSWTRAGTNGQPLPPLCPKASPPAAWGSETFPLPHPSLLGNSGADTPPRGVGVIGPKSVSLNGTRGSSPVQRTCCTCVHLPGFMQFSKGLWSQEHQEPWSKSRWIETSCFESKACSGAEESVSWQKEQTGRQAHPHSRTDRW